MSWLFEDPTTLIVAGVLIEGLLAVVLINTRQLKVVLAMVGVLLLILAGVAIEQIVVTDYEQIEAVLDGTARSLRANNVAGVLERIDPQAVEMRQRAEGALSQARITDAHFKDLKVHFKKLASPPAADAEFIANIKGSYRTSIDGGGGTLIRRFRISFRRQGDRWLMTSYQDLGSPVGPGRIPDGAHAD